MTSYLKHKHHRAHQARIAQKVVKKRLVDHVIYGAAIVEPLFSLPQAYQIYTEKSAGSVSILTWAGYELMTLIWLWYGFVHKDKAILVYQCLFFIIDGSVLVGAIYYGGKLF